MGEIELEKKLAKEREEAERLRLRENEEREKRKAEQLQKDAEDKKRQEEIAKKRAAEEIERQKREALKDAEKQKQRQAEREQREAEEAARVKDREEAKMRAAEERRLLQERIKKDEEETKRMEKWEEKRKAEAEERQKLNETRDNARKMAEELRKREEEEEEAGRRARELHRKQALEELQRIKRQSQVVIKDALTDPEPEDKENIPRQRSGDPAPSDIAQQMGTDENKRLSLYNSVKTSASSDPSSVKDAEAAITASRSARDEALSTRQRIEADLSSAASKLEPEAGAPAYYGLASTARRESRDLDTKVRDSYINDDLADEVEAIRLAADFTSRRLMSEQKRDRRDSVAVSAASASRLRIRSLLDKQKTVREDEEAKRREKRESQDISKFLWVYR